MILIHTALLCEAQSFIEYYKLKKTHSTPKIYANDSLIICISGVGKENTIKALNYIFSNYKIQKAFNIGVAGTNDTSISIGELYYIPNENQTAQKELIAFNLPTLPLTTSDTVVQISDNTTANSKLYDMEAKYFYKISSASLEEENIFTFKVVSDHLNTNRLNKDFVKSLIAKHTILHKILNLT